MFVGFGIRIVDVDGNGIEGAEVRADFPYATESNCTDKDGWVRFERNHAFGDAIRTTIYVDGEMKAENIWIENENTYSFVIQKPLALPEA